MKHIIPFGTTFAEAELVAACEATKRLMQVSARAIGLI